MDSGLAAFLRYGSTPTLISAAGAQGSWVFGTPTRNCQNSSIHQRRMAGKLTDPIRNCKSTLCAHFDSSGLPGMISSCTAAGLVETKRVELPPPPVSFRAGSRALHGAQEMSERPVCHLRTQSSRYLIPGAEVDSLVYPDINHIVSHIREAVVHNSLVNRGARD